MYDAPGVTVHFTFVASQVVGVDEQVASAVTTHVGKVELGHEPPLRLIGSWRLKVFHPPEVVAESSKISAWLVEESIARVAC